MRTTITYLLPLLLFTLFTACGTDQATSTTEGTEETEADPTTDLLQESEPAGEEHFKWIISEADFNGLKSGLPFTELGDQIEPGVVEMGEGDFEVHFIPGPDGQPIGYILPHPWDESLTGTMVFRSSQVKTSAGVGVGDTYGDLLRTMPDIEVHGSEIEGYTYAEADGIGYRLDSYNWVYDLTGIEIDPATQILEVNVYFQLLEDRQPPGMSANLFKLQGRWQSVDDPNSIVTYLGDQKMEVYEGVANSLTESTIEIGANCLNGENPVAEDDTYISDIESGLCWAIIKLTEDELELAFMGRGNTLKYKRLE